MKFGLLLMGTFSISFQSKSFLFVDKTNKAISNGHGDSIDVLDHYSFGGTDSNVHELHPWYVSHFL